MNAIIERLKNNDAHRIFADLTPEEQDCIKMAVPNIEILSWDLLTHKLCWLPFITTDVIRWSERAFRIKPEYQPEPEYEYLEIGIHEDALGIWADEDGITMFTYLQSLPALPKFRGYSDGNSVFYVTGLVATKRAEGKKVRVRFEK